MRLVVVAIVDDDAAEFLGGIQQGLKAVIPLGRCFVEKNHAAVGEAKLQVAGLANMPEQGRRRARFSGWPKMRVSRTLETKTSTELATETPIAMRNASP